ncbi:MAG: TIGR03668 family PPOX class F420-dependent oxidoreductase [Candidatus Binatia bacterium]
MAGVLPLSEEERRFVERQRVAHLATADAGGAPHVIPVCYALVRECLYFVVDDKPKRTVHQLKRLRNIAENHRVALVIDEYHEDWTRLAYLLVRGIAAPVNDREEYAAVLATLRHRYPPYRTMALQFARNPMVRIEPTARHFWCAGGAR